MLVSAAGNDVFGLLGSQDVDNGFTFLFREHPVSVAPSFILEGRNAVLEILGFEPFGMVFRIPGQAYVTGADQQQYGHGSAGGSTFFELFLLNLEICYLFWFHTPQCDEQGRKWQVRVLCL